MTPCTLSLAAASATFPAHWLVKHHDAPAAAAAARSARRGPQATGLDTTTPLAPLRIASAARAVQPAWPATATTSGAGSAAGRKGNGKGSNDGGHRTGRFGLRIRGHGQLRGHALIS